MYAKLLGAGLIAGLGFCASCRAGGPNAGAAEGAAPATGQPAASIPAPTRADVARAYLRVDRAFSQFLAREGEPDEAKLREFNLRFDHVTNLFFQSKMREAVDELGRLLKLIESDTRKSTVFCDGFTVDQDPVAPPGAECPKADGEREGLLKRLNAITPASEAHRRMIEIEKARVAFLTNRPDYSNSESFLQDWNCDRLGDAEKASVEVLEKGMLPEVASSQHYWPLIIQDGPPIPMRKPELRAEKRANPNRDAEIARTGRPVIIALNGAGGDETIFQCAYGSGMLVREADKRDAILVLPRTEFFGFYPDALPRLLDQLELFEKIDRSRVYLMGHSLGAQAALGLARKHHDLIRAVVLIAGGIGIAPNAGTKPGDLPPVLMIAGELDRIFPATRLDQEIESARAAGLDVELRIKKDYGHVFVVNGSLPDAIEWLEMKGLPKSR